ncbi:MAG: hypothetical protein Q7K55_03250 [Candidatus Levybacteria bacterium]|nr:hypothetical protein [Candidatus Levybacteria bacterium]
MGSIGGFYKGEKKKSKKNKDKRSASFNAPIFTMPEIITKKKKTI